VGALRGDELLPERLVASVVSLASEAKEEAARLATAGDAGDGTGLGLVARPRLLELGGALCTLERSLQDESPEELPPTAQRSLDEMPALFRAAAAQVATLVALLALEPAPLATSRDRTRPVPAVGIHRVATVEVLAHLLAATCPAVDQAVAESGALAAVVDLFFANPWNNALHIAASRVFQAALQSPVAALRQPLVQASELALPTKLAAVLVDAVDRLPGARLGLVGPAAALAAFLCDLASADGCPADLADALAGNAAWREAARGAECALEQLRKEKEGTIAGPKPVSPPISLGGGLMNSGLSGRDLLALVSGYLQQGGGGGGGGGFGDDERGPAGRSDSSRSWGADKGDRGFGGGGFGGGGGWGGGGGERPKLNLAPRTKPIEDSNPAPAPASSIFGAAKPVEVKYREEPSRAFVPGEAPRDAAADGGGRSRWGGGGGGGFRDRSPPPAAGERPKLNLKPRSVPVEEPAAPAAAKSEEEAPASKPSEEEAPASKPSAWGKPN